MKNPSVISFLTILLLAIALCIHGKNSVLDSDGFSVKDGAKYFIQPVNGKGGGLVPAAITILPFCPLGITQTLLPYQPGLPVTLTYPNHQFTYINIEFESNIWPVCNDFPDPKLWVVANSAAKEPPILIGGEKGSRRSYFYVERTGDGSGTRYLRIAPYGYVGATPGVWLSAPQLFVTTDRSKALIVKFKKIDDNVTMPATSTSKVEKLGLKMFPFY